MTAHPPSTPLEGGDTVPTQWPPGRDDTPKAAWTVRGLPVLPGMILLWLMPQRVGASLAASGWRAAIAAHVLGLAVGAGLILCAELLPMLNPVPRQQRFGIAFGYDIPSPEMSLSEYVRAPFASLVVVAHSASAGPVGFLVPLLTIAGIEVGVMLLTVVLMPFAAAGEPARRLFGRCLRLTWWSTTMAIPLGLGWLAGPLSRGWLDLPDVWHPVDFIGLTLFGVWWLVVLLRSGYRYAGPPEGPAWQPRRPRCEQCGYQTVGLPTTRNCPECGRAVADSLPDHQTAPSFASAKSVAGAIRAFWPTVWQAVTDKTFFDRLAIHTGYARARTFCLAVCFLNTGLVFLGVLATENALLKTPVLGHLLADATVAAGAFLFGQILLAGLAAGLISALGRRAVQPATLATFYAMSSLVALTGGAVLYLLLCTFVDVATDSFTTTWLRLVDALLAVLLAVGLVAAGVGVWTTLRNTRRAIVQTRFANA